MQVIHLAQPLRNNLSEEQEDIHTELEQKNTSASHSCLISIHELCVIPTDFMSLLLPLLLSSVSKSVFIQAV